MAEQKGLGSKILGIFVETHDEKAPEPSDAEKTPEEIVAELAGTSPAGRRGAGPGQGVAALDPQKLAATASGPADFEAIFREAGMDREELDRVRKAEELLRSLPEATPQPVRKQIVEASLKAFGFEVEKIVAGAQNQKRALDAYVKINETATAKAIQNAELEIRSLNDKISSLRSDIEKRTANLGSLSSAAQARKAQVQKVIDFFQASPGPASAPQSPSRE